jgi:transposase
VDGSTLGRHSGTLWTAFNAFLCRFRTFVERFFNKLKYFRAVAARYDKTPENHLASVKLVSARLRMRFNEAMA